MVVGDTPPAGPGVDRDSVSAGIGGLAPVLAEIGQYRALTNGLTAMVVDRPDQWWAVPGRLRTVHGGTSMPL